MKFITVPDVHIRASIPEKRLPGYLEQHLLKFNAVIDYALAHDAHLLFPGDIFDNARIPYDVTSTYIAALQLLKPKLRAFAVPGQHDTRYHSRHIRKTPLYNMAAANVIEIVGYDKDGIYNQEPVVIDGIHLYGEGWNMELPASIVPGSIVLIHAMIIHESKLWEQQKDYQEAVGLLKNEKYRNFRYLVTGDNHQTFIYGSADRWVINSGSLMRSGKNQFAHEPVVHLFDTVLPQVPPTPLYLPVKPAEEVFDVTAIAEERGEKLFTQEMEEFVSSLDIGTNRPDFDLILQEVMKQGIQEGIITEAIKSIINETMEKCHV